MMADPSFWDKAAKKYAASPIKDMAAYEETLGRTRHYLERTDHLLEVGCGTGTTALTLAGAVRQVTATDLSGKMLEIAKGKLADRGVANVRFQQCKITEPLNNAPFDAICAFSILHLVDDLPATLSHLYSQLKPGGYVISKTACLHDMNMFIPPMIKLMKVFGKAPHVLLFDAATLENAFRDAGLEVVETGYFGKNRSARFIVAQRPG
ncbi:class I SAM-dependent methyltransferase [Yoonia sp. GPGPB17]|uniref:class I SAM-dependent methyltransferase n=1 Tax=Yoonia sp. GPGPB17 TaxID=3026147 RepID=UPI0030C016AF